MGLTVSKGHMYTWVTHTWNTIKGECPHGCTYCHPAGTQIMMSDFTQKDIKDVIIGDSIIGIVKQGGVGYYKFTESVVIDKSRRKSKTIRLKTDDSEIICTKEHPLMGSTEARNCSDWKAARSFSPFENLRFVSKNSRGVYSTEHRMGYMRGIIDGDGCIFKHYNKDGNEYLGFEIVCIDEQLRNKIKKDFIELFGITLKEGIKHANKNSYGGNCIMLTTRKSKDVEFFNDKTDFRLNKEFAKGYIAGMIDTDGSIGKKGEIRISQSITVNAIKHKRITDCCDLLQIKYIIESAGIRIYSNFEIGIMLLFDFGIFHSGKSKRLIIGSSIKGTKHSEIQSIEVAEECDVYNLQTKCENFIANGFIVHNCYMKRWGKQKPVRFDEKELKTDLGSGNFIFVGSSCDMFAEDIPKRWIYQTLEYCRKFDNTYLFQSKNPHRFCEFSYSLPEKTKLCTTIETNRYYSQMGIAPYPEYRAMAMGAMNHYYYSENYVTIEPIADFDLYKIVQLIKRCHPSQVNIGADSGNNNLPEPSKEKILALIDELQKFTVIDKKHNLGRLINNN